MADDRPQLRLVGSDERAPAGEPSDAPVDRRGGERDGDGDGGDGPGRRIASVVAVVGTAVVLLAGIAIPLRLLLRTSGGSDEGSPEPTTVGSTRPAGGLPFPVSTVAPASEPTTAAPTAPTAAPSTGPGPAPGVGGTPGLAPIGVVSGPSGDPATPAPAPTSGSARLRIFNAYAAGLEVWDVAGTAPVRYGTVGDTQFVEMTVDGRLLPGGVDVDLRFVPVGADPLAPGAKRWAFTPPADSSQTLVLTDNGGLRVVRIDDRRASDAGRPGAVHVVPVVFHLVLAGTRTHQWAADGGGCLGHLTTGSDEFDVAAGTVLRLADGRDPTCSTSLSGPLALGGPGAFAVVGVEQGNGVQLLGLPLG